MKNEGLDVIMQDAQDFCGTLTISPLELESTALIEGSSAVPNVSNVSVSSNMFTISLSNGSLIAFHSNSTTSLKNNNETIAQRGGRLSEDEIADLLKHVKGMEGTTDPVVLVADPGADIICAEPFMYGAEKIFTSWIPKNKNVTTKKSIQSFIAVRRDGEVLLWMRSADLDEAASEIALETAAQSQQQQQQQQQQKKRKQLQQATSIAPTKSSSIASYSSQVSSSSLSTSSSSSSPVLREDKKEAYGGFALISSVNVLENGLLPKSLTSDLSKHREISQAHYNVSSETLFLVYETGSSMTHVIALPLRIINSISLSAVTSLSKDVNSNTNVSISSQLNLEMGISVSQCLMSRNQKLTLYGTSEHAGGVFITTSFSSSPSSSTSSSTIAQEVCYFNHSSSKTRSASAFQSITESDATLSLPTSDDLPPIHLPVFTTSTFADLFSRARGSAESDPYNDSTRSPESISNASIGSLSQMFAQSVDVSETNQELRIDNNVAAACFIGNTMGSGSSVDQILVVTLQGRLYSIALDEKSSKLTSAVVSKLDSSTGGWSDIVAVTGMTIAGPSVYFVISKQKSKNQTTFKSLLAFDIASGLLLSSTPASDHILWQSHDEYVSGCLFTATAMKSGIKSQKVQIERFGPISLPSYSRQLLTLLNRVPESTKLNDNSIHKNDDEFMSDRLSQRRKLLSKSLAFRIAYGNASNALGIFNGDVNIEDNTISRRSLDTEPREIDSDLVGILRELIKSSWLLSGAISIETSLSESNHYLLLNTAVSMACDALEWAIFLRDSGFQDDISLVRSVITSNLTSSSLSEKQEGTGGNSASSDFLLTSSALLSSSSSTQPSSSSHALKDSSRSSCEFIRLTLSECFSSVSSIWARLSTLAPGLAIAVGVGSNIVNSEDTATPSYTNASAALHTSYVAPSFTLWRTVQLVRSIGVTKQQLEWTLGLRLAGDGTALPQKQSRLLPPIPPPSPSSSEPVGSASLLPVAGVPSGKGAVKVRLPSKQFFETTSDLIDDILAINYFNNTGCYGISSASESGQQVPQTKQSVSTSFESRLSSASSNNIPLDRSRNVSTESAVQTFYDNRAGDNIVQKSSDDENRGHARRDGGHEVEDDRDEDSDDEDALWDAHVPSELQKLWTGAKRLHTLLLPQILFHLKTQLHVRALIGREDAVDAPMSRAHAAIVLAEDDVNVSSSTLEDSLTGEGIAPLMSFSPALATGGGRELGDDDLMQLSLRASESASAVFSGQHSLDDLTTLRMAREAFLRLRVSLAGYKAVLTSDTSSLARSLIHPKRKTARKRHEYHPNTAVDNSDDEFQLIAPSLIAEPPINFELVVRFAYASSIYAWHSVAYNPNDAVPTLEEDDSAAAGSSSSSSFASLPPQYSRAQSRAIAIHTVDVVSLLESYHSQVPATWRGELPPAIKSHMRLEATQKKINVSNGATTSVIGNSSSEGSDQQQKPSDSARFKPLTDSYKNTFIRALKTLPQPCKVIRQKDAMPLKQVWAIRAASELLSHRSQSQQYRNQSRSIVSLPQQQLTPSQSVESPPHHLRSKSPSIPPSRKSSSSKHVGPPALSPSAPPVSPQTLVHVRILCRVGESVEALRLLLALDHWEAALSMLTAAEEADGIVRHSNSNSNTFSSPSHVASRGVNGIDARGSSMDHLVNRMVTSHSACTAYLDALEGGESAFESSHSTRQGKTLQDMDKAELLLSYAFLQRICENSDGEWASEISFISSQNLLPNSLISSTLQPANAPPSGLSGTSAPQAVFPSASNVPASNPSTFTSSSRRSLQPSTIATQSRLSAMSPSIASVSSLLRWSSSAHKRAMCWKAVFKHAVESGCAARVLQCWRRLPPAMSLISLLAVLRSCLSNDKSDARLLPAWAIFAPLVALSYLHAEEVEGMFRHMRSQAMQKNEGNPLRTWGAQNKS